MAEPSPRPWSLSEANIRELGDYVAVVDPTTSIIVTQPSTDRARENYKLIVRCVNAAEEMARVLQLVESECGHDCDDNIEVRRMGPCLACLAKDALAKWEGNDE